MHAYVSQKKDKVLLPALQKSVAVSQTTKSLHRKSQASDVSETETKF